MLHWISQSPRTITTPLFLLESCNYNRIARILTRTNFFKHPYWSELVCNKLQTLYPA